MKTFTNIIITTAILTTNALTMDYRECNELLYEKTGISSEIYSTRDFKHDTASFVPLVIENLDEWKNLKTSEDRVEKLNLCEASDLEYNLYTVCVASATGVLTDRDIDFLSLGGDWRDPHLDINVTTYGFDMDYEPKLSDMEYSINSLTKKWEYRTVGEFRYISELKDKADDLIRTTICGKDKEETEGEN